MPFHIKRPNEITAGDVYYKGDGNQWTGVYADRKQYANKSDADAQVANPVIFVNGFPTKLNCGFANATVVTE